MKKTVLISLLLVMFVGCSSFRHTRPDGTTLVYERLGDIDMTGLHIEDTNGIYIGIDSVKSDAQMLTDAVGALVGLTEKVLDMYTAGMVTP